MPLRIIHETGACTIRPTPLVSISQTVLKNPAGEAFGTTYVLTLTGTLIADQGTPYAFKTDGSRYPFFGTTPNSVGPYGAFDNDVSHFSNNRPPEQIIPTVDKSNSIFAKQKALRALFSKDGQRLEITDFNDDEPTIICYPRMIGDIQFEEGVYVDICRYTITLEVDTLLNKDLQVDSEGTLVPKINGAQILTGQTEAALKALGAAYINDYSEEWSLEADDALGEDALNPRSYRISHSISAVGKTHYHPDGSVEPAWVQAKKFVQRRLANSINSYPNIMGNIGSGTINLVASYGGFNQIRTEQINEPAGSYSVTENWLLASGNSYENYNMSISSSIDNPFVTVNIDGNIKGLTSFSPSGFGVAGSGSAFQNALSRYHKISNSGNFGMSSDIYKRANNLVAVQLNSQPKSVSLGVNDFVGEITYNLQFDNRPTNIISGVLSEIIQVNDTYPGDVFAIIPVIGRKTGPVLQYIGGRTEYKRDLQINLLMDYTKVPYGNTRSSLLLQKPSVMEPMASQIAGLINELSPANEPGVRKYFIYPPQENWNPKEGQYNFSVSWVYELDS